MSQTSGRKILVRMAVPEDARELAELAARTFSEAFATVNHPQDISLHLAANYGEQQQRAELNDPAVDTLLAEHDGSMIGFAQLRCGPTPQCVSALRPLEIRRFYVAAAWHGRGAAQALMGALETRARARSARELWLGVWEHNPRARAFYRKCGFAAVGSHTFMLGNDAQIDCLMMRRISGGRKGTAKHCR